MKRGDNESIEGRHPVLSGILGNRSIKEVLVARGSRGQAIDRILEEARKRHIPTRLCDREELDARSISGHHQGVMAIAEPKAYSDLGEILQVARAMGEDPLVLMLDSVQDPQNLGAIIRSAESFGVHGVVIPERRACGVTPAVIRASCGAWEHIRVARVKNLARSIDLLKEAGLWIVGASEEASQVVFEAELRGSLGIVMGGEDRGIGRLVREKCDFLVRIPTKGRTPSLNVSVACGIILYEVSRQRYLSSVSDG